MIALQSILLLLFILPIGSSDTCTYKYFTQPPNMLDCDPLGISIVLKCFTASLSDNVTWYWTQNFSEAGVSGTAILPGDTSDNYQVTGSGTNDRVIGFTVSESTLGYYWCEISNAVNVSVRPSTITPVCPPMNSSQRNKCSKSHILDFHHDDTDECAEEDSPTMISKPPLPTSCAGSPTLTLIAVATTMTPSAATMTPSATTMNPSAATMTPSSATVTPSAATMTPSATTINPSAATMTSSATTMNPSAATMTPSSATATPSAATMTPSAATMTSTVSPPTTQQSALVPVVVTFCVVVVVLVAVVVVIIVLVCVLRMNTMKDKEQRSKNGSEVLNQQPLMELENVYYSTCDPKPNVGKQEAVPEYSVVGGSKEKNEYSVTISEYARWSRATPIYSEVTSKPTTEPGIPIQSEYSLATSADDTEQIHSEYSLAGNVYSAPRGEQPEYEVVNMTNKQKLPPEEKESPPHPANGAENLNASPEQESQELSPTEEAMPVYAQPDLSKKKKKPHSPLLDSNGSPPPPIPPQAEVL